MVLFTHNGMLHTLRVHYVDDGLVKLWDPIAPYDIVLTKGPSRGPGSCWTQPSGVFNHEKLHQLRLGGLLEKNLTKIDDCIRMSLSNDIAGEICLGLRENGEGMNHGH